MMVVVMGCFLYSYNKVDSGRFESVWRTGTQNYFFFAKATIAHIVA